MNTSALIITFISGIAFIIGYLITILINNKKSLIVFSVGFAFSILLGLILFDLLPECIELVNKRYLIIIYIVIGILILKSLDLLLPGHKHNHSHNHMEHINLMSCVAILLHNIIEATAIYTTSVSNIKIGAIMSLGVICHNIPLGIQISSLAKNNKEGLVMTSLLAISSIIGAITIIIFNITFSPSVEGLFIGITLGMLIYLVFFELLCEVKEHIKEKEMFYGLFMGVMIIILISNM
jgi:zinc transporter ZupT